MSTISAATGDIRFRQVLLRTRSLDEAERRSSALLSPHRLRVAEERSFDAQIEGVSLGAVAAMRMSYGSAVTVVGAPPDGFVAVTVPLCGAMIVEHGGHRFEMVAQRSGAVITPSSSLTLRWSPGLVLLCIRLEVEALQAFADVLDPRGKGTPLSFLTPITDPRAVQSLLGWVSTVQVVDRQGLAGPVPAAAPVLTRLREQVMTSLLAAQPNSRRRGLLSPEDTVTRRAVREAVAAIEADPAGCATPTQLARRTGVGLRALQQGFREVLDTTPHTYATRARLRRAHDDLVISCAGDGTTVTAVAQRWGFTNLGRFSKLYVTTFGELPSHTMHAR